MTFGESIIMYWPIILFAITGVISIVSIWVNLNNKVNTLKGEASERDKDIAELKGRVNTMQPTLGTIQTDIAVIKNTLEFIKGTVSKPPQVTNNL